MRRRILAVLALVCCLGSTLKGQAEQFRFKPPINLGPPVNTTLGEGDPYVTADGQKLFFVREIGGNADIYMSIWSDTNWSEPVNLGANVNSGTHEWSPSLSPDGKKLYFTAFGRPGSLGGWDIWCSTWDSIQQQWGPAQNLGSVINTPRVDWTAKISYNGQSLYYMSNGKGHIQGQALYSSQWNGTAWTSPIPFPDNISNTATEERPSLTHDENTMYFVRWLVIYGGSHQAICVTEKNPLGGWSNPVVLDSTVNFFNYYGSGSSGPSITPDGRKLYFASSRTGGVGDYDIWMAERIILGDLNLDGRITLIDVMLELNKVFLSEVFPADIEMGDLNCDSLYSPADVVLILLKLYLYQPFPCNRIKFFIKSCDSSG